MGLKTDGRFGTVTVEDNLILPKVSGAGIKVDPAAPTFGWRDIIGNVQPKASGAGSPTRAAYAGANLADYSFVANDVVDFVYHIPHDYVPMTDIYWHVHWSHTGTTVSGNVVFNAYYSCAKRDTGEVFPAEKNLTITYATTDVATTPRYSHRVDEVQMSSAVATATQIANADIEVDGLILLTLKLTTLPTIGGGGKLFVHTCDIHYQSNDAATKNRAPNFYT